MSPLWWSRDLQIGDHGRDVEAVQQLLGLPITGHFDYDTAAAVRGLQMVQRLDRSGVVDEETASVLGPRAQDHLPPSWWSSPLKPGDEDYEEVALPFGGEDGVRRTQGQYGIYPTGVIDQQTALLLNTLGGTYGRA